MEANAFWMVLALAALLLGILLRRNRAAQPSEPRTGRASHPYHCVAIKSGMGSCEQARRIRGCRYLSAEAPPIPLPGCRVRECTCVYVHFDDRRQGSRRQMLTARAPAVAAGHDERRGAAGRRKSDLLAAHIGS